MSKPLVPKADHAVDGKAFHDAVFAEHGRKCHFRKSSKLFNYDRTLRARGDYEKCNHDASDAMHIIPRGVINSKVMRFAAPEANGRPGCRTCHVLQESGLLEFSYADRMGAYDALMAVPGRKVPVPMPVP